MPPSTSREERLPSRRVPLYYFGTAYGCLLTGGDVTRLEISPEYGAALLQKLFPFVAVGSDYAGQLTGFDTHDNDVIYLATSRRRNKGSSPGGHGSSAAEPASSGGASSSPVARRQRSRAHSPRARAACPSTASIRSW